MTCRKSIYLYFLDNNNKVYMDSFIILRFKQMLSGHTHMFVMKLQYTFIDLMDFGETFSPVIKRTIRIVHVILVSSKWTMRQLDVKNAFFLHSFLKETVYVEQAPGFRMLINQTMFAS